MENENLYPKEIQKGVIFYRNVAKGFGDTDAVDIDVDSRLKEVEIWCDLLMKDSKKSFPNVEKLIIKSNVFEISIPNSLFPNVKWVESENARFKTGSCLIQTGFSISNILLNTFCKKPGEAIETDGVLAIKNGAFSGCESTNMTDGINVLFSDDIEPDSFAGSAFEQLPFVNGVKMANNSVIDIDKTGVIDMDVADGVDELTLKYDLCMAESKKSFPDVKRLIIDEMVFRIEMPNTLFPNVRYVLSYSHMFESGEYLIGRTYGFTSLVNVFCHDTDEVIDLISKISLYQALSLKRLMVSHTQETGINLLPARQEKSMWWFRMVLKLLENMLLQTVI